MNGDQQLRGELAGLVSALIERLRWEQEHGTLALPAAPSPRKGLTLPGDGGADAGAPVDGAPVDEVAGDARGEGIGAGVSGEGALDRVRQELGDCRRCRLAEGRKHLVFGVGHAEADLMLIGEAPGLDEDRKGEPFVGAAGQLLTRMIKAMGLDRREVYIANIIKCRPPNNRDPRPDEIERCEPVLLSQIEAIGPRLIIALGNFAAKTLLRTETGITRLRGRWHSYHGIPLMPTFHPAYLLRNPEGKRPVWEDLKQVMAEMDRLGLARRR